MSQRRWSPSAPLMDSSDEGESDGAPDDTLEVPAQPMKKPLHILSNLHPTPNENIFFLTPDEVNAIDLSSLIPTLPATIIALGFKETVCLLGTYRFCVLQGSVACSGVVLSPSPRIHRVFAPRSSPLPILEGAIGKDSIAGLNLKLPPRLRPLAQAPATLLLIQELNTGVKGLGRICRTFNGVFEPSRWQKDETLGSLQLPGVYLIAEQTRDVQVFSLPVSWDLALPPPPTEPSDTPVGVHLVKGPKRSGKSTFARTLVNTLLTQYQRVAFLECDLGQSEFTPGGMVALNVVHKSLFGPPFTHPTLPNYAHFIGGSTPRSTPSHYISAIQSLVESYHLDVQLTSDPMELEDDDARISDVIPLVVNTMGWNKGLGADLTQKIEEIVQPTVIYEIEAPASFEREWATPAPAPPYPPQNHSAKVFTLQPIPPSVLSMNYTPADHRALCILSYFHAVFPDAAGTTTGDPPLSEITAASWTTSLPLRACPPYEVEPARTFEKVILTGAGMEDVVPDEIDRVMNGAIVGLVCCQPGTLDNDPSLPSTSSTTGAIPYTQGYLPPSTSSSTCLGLALVRSVSTVSPIIPPPPGHPTTFHILSPLPLPLLERSNILVKGEMELPIWGMLDLTDENGGVEGGANVGVPYLQWGKGEGLGGDKRRIRRNLMRRGQM
ncbi:hypothetical protein BDZ94DRAFT_1176032 [Collybia nuda]|uniref:Polynucleotide 5'-hydroxyl-kinase GRC3 n=1 Tax=Collybia nuda TaxID=64659 RepID=A0A9P5XX62_9AGAR|nr:hypothetical protein BDZ94DRAFT_1176032 [Collybia nuda]